MLAATSCGGGGGPGASGTNSDCAPDTPEAPVAPGTPGLVMRPFVNSGDYTYDADEIQISDGAASLMPVDQTDDDNALTGFGGGVHNLTRWDEDNDRLALQAAQTSGHFISRAMDAGASTSWSALAWTPRRPYDKELPDNALSETAYAEGNADMTGNVLLLHMNETGWNGTPDEVVDSSGSGNHGTAYNGANTTNSGRFSGAGNFNGVSGHLKVPDSDSLDITGPMTITAWIYPRTAGGSNQGGIVSKANGAASGKGYNFSIDEGNCSQRSLMFNWGCSNQDALTYNQWQHVAVVYDGVNAFFYVNAAPAGNDQPFPRAANTLDIAIGSWSSSGATKIFDGHIDEVAIYNRALSEQEVIDSYRRGAVRLKYQVRSCDDAACDTEQFIGPDGASSTFYSELNNPEAGLPNLSLINVPDNRYFQYKAYFETDNALYSPELRSVMIGPQHYPGDNPTLVNNIGQTYSLLNTFTETPGAGNAGVVRYQISNNGAHWYYHNGVGWAPATAGYDHSNNASEVNAKISTFHLYAMPGTFYFKAFLHSDTYQQVKLDQVDVGYTN